jgi:hypothetical protein
MPTRGVMVVRGQEPARPGDDALKTWCDAQALGHCADELLRLAVAEASAASVASITRAACESTWMYAVVELKGVALPGGSGTAELLVIRDGEELRGALLFSLQPDWLQSLLQRPAPPDFPPFESDVVVLCSALTLQSGGEAPKDVQDVIRVVLPRAVGDRWSVLPAGAPIAAGCTLLGTLSLRSWKSNVIPVDLLPEALTGRVCGSLDFSADNGGGRLVLHWPFGSANSLSQRTTVGTSLLKLVEDEGASRLTHFAMFAGPLQPLCAQVVDWFEREMKHAVESMSWLHCVELNGLLLSVPVSAQRIASTPFAQLVGTLRAGDHALRVAVSAPLNGSTLLLSTLDPIRVPLPETTGQGEPTFLDEVLEGLRSIEIREIAVGLARTPHEVSGLTSLDVTFGIGESRTDARPVLQQQWDSLLEDAGFRDLQIRFELLPELKLTASFGLWLCGAELDFEGTLPECRFYGGLRIGDRIDGEALIRLLSDGVLAPKEPPPRPEGVPAHDKPSSWFITGLEVDLDLQASYFEFAIQLESDWTWTVGGCSISLRSVLLRLARSKEKTSIAAGGSCVIGGVELSASVAYDSGEWQFDAEARLAEGMKLSTFFEDASLDLGAGVSAAALGGDGQSREFLSAAHIKRVSAHFATTANELAVTCECGTKLGAQEDLALSVAIRKRAGVLTVDAVLDLGTAAGVIEFALRLKRDQQGTWIVASCQSTATGPRPLSDWIGPDLVPSATARRVMQSLEVGFQSAFVAKADQAFVLGGVVSAKAALGELPLLGSLMPKDLKIELEQLRVVVASRELSGDGFVALAALLPPDSLPAPKKDAPALPAGLNVSAVLHANLPPLSGGAGNEVTNAPLVAGPPRGNALAAQPPADAGEKRTPTHPVGAKTFGPLQISGVRAECSPSGLAFCIDSSLRLGGVSMSIDGLRVSGKLEDLFAGKFEPTLAFTGLGLSFRSEAVEIGGALFVKDIEGGCKRYQGAAVVKAGKLALSAIGFYQELRGQHSLCVYGVLDYPIGGPPFFCVLGLAAGFGYGIRITPPDIGHVHEFPLVSLAKRNSDKPSTPDEDLARLGEVLADSPGDCFLAIGVRFSSFKIADSFALLIISFGRQFEVDLLGVSHIQAPPKEGGASVPLAALDISLKGTFAPQSGFLGIQGLLLPSSYVLSKSCQLSGGFAFFSWFDGAPADRVGDFVLTVGGYHPKFPKVRHPHYPDVPRLAFNWKVDDSLSLKGDAYFALTPAMMMAGGHFEANLSMGAVHAWLKFGADFEIEWLPYHYSASAYVDIGVEISFEFCGTQHLAVEIGARLELEGPEFSGYALIDLTVMSVCVRFGATEPEARKEIDWPAFRASFLPEELGTLTVVDGLVARGTSALLKCGESGLPTFEALSALHEKNADGTDLWRFIDLGTLSAEWLRLQLDCVVPVTTLRIGAAPRGDSPVNSFGVRPMKVAPAAVKDAELHVTVLYRASSKEAWAPAPKEKLQLEARSGSVPAALWGTTPTADATEPAVLKVLLGATVSAVAGTSPRTDGLPASPKARSVVFPRAAPARADAAAVSKVTLYPRDVPPVPAGEYLVLASQSLSMQAATGAVNERLLDKGWRFRIGGHRGALAPSEVHSVFPPSGARGVFRNVLPQIVFSQSTLPWERPSGSRPWLALLLFINDEIGAAKPLAADNPKDSLSVIDVPKELLKRIRPGDDEVALLAHVRANEDSSTATGDVRRAFVLCGRHPEPGATHTAHLVSLVDSPGECVPGHERLVTLYSWTFFCEATDAEDEAARRMAALTEVTPGVGLGTIPAPQRYTSSDSAGGACYVAPFLPLDGAEWAAAPDRQFSRFTARELGRLLAAQSGKAATALVNWRHRCAQDLRSRASDIEAMPADVTDMLARLGQLEGVPLPYLLPKESGLPEESILLFHIDPAWRKNLLAGALEIGPPALSHAVLSGMHADALEAEAETIVSGFLLRSQAVPTLQSWRIEGYGRDTQHEATDRLLTLLRAECVRPHVLLCLFEGALRHVELHHGAEVRHFTHQETSGKWQSSAHFARACLAPV